MKNTDLERKEKGANEKRERKRRKKRMRRNRERMVNTIKGKKPDK